MSFVMESRHQRGRHTFGGTLGTAPVLGETHPRPGQSRAAAGGVLPLSCLLLNNANKSKGLACPLTALVFS